MGADLCRSFQLLGRQFHTDVRASRHFYFRIGTGTPRTQALMCTRRAAVLLLGPMLLMSQICFNDFIDISIRGI